MILLLYNPDADPFSPKVIALTDVLASDSAQRRRVYKMDPDPLMPDITMTNARHFPINIYYVQMFKRVSI